MSFATIQAVQKISKLLKLKNRKFFVTVKIQQTKLELIKRLIAKHLKTAKLRVAFINRGFFGRFWV
jgi:hypothetical protein